LTVVLLSGDLMAVSQVQGAISRTGAGLRTATTAEQAISICNELPVAVVVVDLGVPAFEVGSLVSSLKRAGASIPKIVAFGPHVHEDRLSAAKAAGCDEVISRGQFFAHLESILGRHGV
jgi:DNA-binding NarL/FixJ family response regulator